MRRFDRAPVDGDLIRQMNARLTHRGPDLHGVWCDGAVGFGHSRLSIIDIAGSAQPMASPDGRHHVCFNGEILNYRALRSSLRYPYRTDGDTETLLAAYHTHGADLVHRLRGQFAFALYDTDSAELLLVRDRLGILPLYYYADGEMIAFASEIKALLPALPRGPELDEASLDDYLTIRSVPAPFTLFKGVRKLPAGHLLRVNGSGQVCIERYWGIPDSIPTGRRRSEDVVTEVAEALESAVAAALVADAPVGAYLSGGVDSSLIVALMSRLRGGEPIETFAAGFGDPRHDELPVARRVSEQFRTNHHEVTVTPSDLIDLWPRLTWHRDAPMSEPADFAVHRLARRASESVKVVLSGEGSDELFAGYPKYAVAPLLEPIARLPMSFRAGLARAVDRGLPRAASRMRVPVRVLGAATAEDRRRAWFAPFNEAERAELVGRCGSHPRPPMVGVSGDVVRRMLAADCQTWLPDNLLERGDRMTMSASVELRPPFLDHHLVELAFSLPTRFKVRGRTTKWVVKEIARRYLPGEIVDRRKVGFRLPLDAWFRGELEDMAWDLLTSPQSLISSLSDVTTVRRLLERHRSGQGNEEIRIWTLLCLELWHQVFFRGGAAEAAPWQAERTTFVPDL